MQLDMLLFNNIFLRKYFFTKYTQTHLFTLQCSMECVGKQTPKRLTLAGLKNGRANYGSNNGF